MQITLDINTKKITDSSGKLALSMVDHPHFFNGTFERIDFFITDNGTPVAISGNDIFQLALDNNFIHTDELMAYSANYRIADAGKGHITVMLETSAQSYLEKLKGGESIPAWLELTVTHAGDISPVVLLQDKVTARGRVLTVEGAPQNAEPEYYTSVQITALLKAGFEIQYSQDGEIWGENSTDAYCYRFRNREIAGEWSDSIPILHGPQGNPGVTPNIDPVTKRWMIDTTDTGVKAEGADGIDGANGTKTYKGTGAPLGTLGADGDYYLDENTANMYLKTSGAWSNFLTLRSGIRFAQTTAEPSGNAVTVQPVTLDASGVATADGDPVSAFYTWDLLNSNGGN